MPAFCKEYSSKLVRRNTSSSWAKLLMDNVRTRYLSVEEGKRLLAMLKGRLAHLSPIIVVAIDTPVASA